MMDPKTYEAIPDSINSPIVFVDNNHIIRYLNKVARIRYYEKRGYSGLIGKSFFDCHDPALQEAIMRLHERLLAGENEIFLMDDDGDLRNESMKLLNYQFYWFSEIQSFIIFYYGSHGY